MTEEDEVILKSVKGYRTTLENGLIAIWTEPGLDDHELLPMACAIQRLLMSLLD